MDPKTEANLGQFAYIAETMGKLVDLLTDARDELSSITGNLSTAESYASDCLGTATDLANDSGDMSEGVSPDLEADLMGLVDRANEIEGAASECESEISYSASRIDDVVEQIDEIISAIETPVN